MGVVRNGTEPEKSLEEGQRAGKWGRSGAESTNPMAGKASMSIRDLRDALTVGLCGLPRIDYGPPS